MSKTPALSRRWVGLLPSLFPFRCSVPSLCRATWGARVAVYFLNRGKPQFAVEFHVDKEPYWNKISLLSCPHIIMFSAPKLVHFDRFCKDLRDLFLKTVPISELEFNWPRLANESSYLPGRGDTVIIKAVPLGWGPPIALRLGWPLGLPQMWVTPRRNFCVWGLAFALAPAKNENEAFFEYIIKSWILVML